MPAPVSRPTTVKVLGLTAIALFIANICVFLHKHVLPLFGEVPQPCEIYEERQPQTMHITITPQSRLTFKESSKGVSVTSKTATVQSNATLHTFRLQAATPSEQSLDQQIKELHEELRRLERDMQREERQNQDTRIVHEYELRLDTDQQVKDHLDW